jgi:hypothetical protein
VGAGEEEGLSGAALGDDAGWEEGAAFVVGGAAGMATAEEEGDG